MAQKIDTNVLSDQEDVNTVAVEFVLANNVSTQVGTGNVKVDLTP